MKIQSLAIAIVLFGASVPALAIPIYVSDAPTNAQATTLFAIDRAQHSIRMNAYELSSSAIVDELIKRMSQGIQVEILKEGQLASPMGAAEKTMQAQLYGEMASARASGDAYFLMDGKKRRYRFDHAKYIIIDDAEVLVGSENYSDTGNPPAGKLGNRGWEVYIGDVATANSFNSILATDTNTSFGDLVVEYGVKSGSGIRVPVQNPVPSSNWQNAYEASAVQPIFSPNSLDAVVALIQGARSSIDIEQMTFHSAWSKAGGSPLLAAVEAAARRGVQVRVLLNDESAFNDSVTTSKPINQPTVDALNGLGLPNLHAMIANVKAMGVDYIHNKGMLIDGNLTLVSSINWDENSFMNNREAAVAITSPQVYAYYENLFQSDWKNSGGR